jgi:hypothetical protein
METLQQLNKIILRVPKALHVLNLFLLVVIISCSSTKVVESTADYKILGAIIQKTKKNNQGRKIVLVESASNEYVTTIIEELRRSEVTANQSLTDSLKQSLGIADSPVFNAVFNSKEYGNLISQKQNAKWNTKQIAVLGIETFTDESVNGQLEVTVSKPIYTANRQYALVFIAEGTTSGILIFKKEKGHWVEDKIIATFFIQKKAKYRKP